MTGREVIKTLGLKLNVDEIEKKGEVFSLLQAKRKTRYYCFALKTIATERKLDEIDIPEKLIKYFENKKEFEGWDNFGVTWDVQKSDPLTIFFRDFSVNQEWDATMRRVVPEIPVDRAMRQKGPETNR